MKPDILSHFEFAAINSIIKLGENACISSINKDLQASLQRHVAIGQTSQSLKRMESKGWLTSKVLPPTPRRGGRRRLAFEIAAAGTAAIKTTREAFQIFDLE